MIFCSAAAYAQDGVEVSNDFMIIRKDTSSEFVRPIFERRVIVPEKSLLFNLGYGVPFIFNDVMGSEWTKKIGTVATFEVDFRKQFQTERTEDGEIIKVPTSWAFGFGLNAGYYAQTAYFDRNSEKLPGLIDFDGDKYEARLDYTRVEESVSLIYVGIPLYLEMGKLNQVKTSAFLRVGVKASLLVSDKFTGEGKYTSKGWYDQPKPGVVLEEPWNVELFNIPQLNFYTDADFYDDPEYKTSPFVLWGTLAGGVNIPFSSLEKNRVSKFLLRIGAKAEYSITKISGATSDPYFTGSAYRINQVNMLGGKGSRMLVVGLELGLIYCL